MGVFSLVIVTMIFAIIRAAVTTSNVSNQMDPIWVELWTSLEMNVGEYLSGDTISAETP
jgi:hypothetical protein